MKSLTIDETLKIFAVLKANYSNFFKTITRIDAEAQVNLWTEMFADDDYTVVGAAVKSYIATNAEGYPPNVGQIKAHIRKLTQPEAMTEQEAAMRIMKAIQNGYYGAEEEFNKLPPILQRLVGHPSQLRVWSQMKEDEVQTVVASNLMRSYKVVEERQRQTEALPSNIRNMIEQVTDKLRLAE